jgi:hypothetical protein
MKFLNAGQMTIQIPTGKRTSIGWILSQPRTLCQQKQKRRMVGGHDPPHPSGGMNDVRSLEPADANSVTRSGGDNKGTSWSQTQRRISFTGRIPKRECSRVPHFSRVLCGRNGDFCQTDRLLASYLFGNIIALAVAAVFFTKPPTVICPMGVLTIPRVSLRTSNVSSLMVSHRLARTS